MIFNLDIIIELCDDDSSLFIMNFNFVKINEFESKVLIFFIGEYWVRSLIFFLNKNYRNVYIYMLDIVMCIILLRFDNKNKIFEYILLNNFFRCDWSG